MIVAIDPGLRHCGLAVVDDQGALVECALIRGEPKARGAPGRSRLRDAVFGAAHYYQPRFTEIPEVYPGRRAIGNPAELIQLAAVVGGIVASWAGPVTVVEPWEWKGTVKKEIFTARILKNL